MSPHNMLFNSYKVFVIPQRVTLGNGKFTNVIGSYWQRDHSTDRPGVPTQCNMLYPDLAGNLLSVSMAAKAGISCTLFSGLCTLVKATSCSRPRRLTLPCTPSRPQAYLMSRSLPRQQPRSPSPLWRPHCCGTTGSANWASTTWPNCPKWSTASMSQLQTSRVLATSSASPASWASKPAACFRPLSARSPLHYSTSYTRTSAAHFRYHLLAVASTLPRSWTTPACLLCAPSRRRATLRPSSLKTIDRVENATGNKVRTMRSDHGGEYM